MTSSLCSRRSTLVCLVLCKGTTAFLKRVQTDLLPPANVVCEGYVFAGRCLSVQTGGLPQLGDPPARENPLPPCQGTPLPRRSPCQGDPPARETPSQGYPLPRRPPATETPLQAHTQVGNWGGSGPGPHSRGKFRGIRSRPTPKGEIWGDQIQVHTQGGNSGGSDPGPHPRGKFRGKRSRPTSKGDIQGDQDQTTPLPKTTAVGGMHPTGMHSCIITRMHSRRMRTIPCSGQLSCHACSLATHTPLQCMPPCHVCPPSHACPPSPMVNRITDACENITLPQLHCGR